MASHPPVAVPLCKTRYLWLFWAEVQNPSGLIAAGSDHLCTECGDWLLINEWKQLGAFTLQANQGVTTPFREGLSEVGNGNPGWTRSHSESVPDTLLTSSRWIASQKLWSVLAPREISLLPHFTLAEGNCVYSSAKLSDHKSVTCLGNSRTPAGFLLSVYIWFILTELLEIQVSSLKLTVLNIFNMFFHLGLESL